MPLTNDVFCFEESLENPMKTVEEKHKKVKDCLDQLRVNGAHISDEEKWRL